MLRTSIATPLLALLIACGSAAAKHADPDPPPVRVAVAAAHAEDLDVLYRASGTVRGRSTAVLTSKVTGNVRSIEVRAGDRVAAGQLLAVLEANDAQAGARRAAAGLDESLHARSEAENALVAAHAAAENAKTSLDRAKKLLDDGALPRQQYDDAETQWRAAAAQEDVAEARVQASRARIDEAGAELAQAKATLDYAKITAPFAGRVIERKVDPGNLASPGTPLLVVEQEGQLRVEAAVDETRAGAIALGDVATAQIDARELSATVSEIVPSIDAASRAFLVKLDLPADAPPLRPGMFARVSFRVGTRPRLVVPRVAVSEQGALDRVFVVDNGRARLRMVTLGEPRGPWVEVLSGLSGGERVVSPPPSDLRDGARVEEGR